MDSQLIATAALALPVLTVWAGAVDVLTRAIPNKVAMALAACFIPFALAAGLSPSQVAAHAACAGLVLALGFLLYSQRLFGGGDAKLLAASALWFGFDSLLPLLSATALAGGALSLFSLATQAAAAQLGLTLSPSRTIPYGAAVATGALAVFPDWLMSL